MYSLLSSTIECNGILTGLHILVGKYHFSTCEHIFIGDFKIRVDNDEDLTQFF